MYNVELFNLLEIDDLGEYFSKCWFEQPHLWCTLFRNDKFTKGNNTTNRLERSNTKMFIFFKYCSIFFSQLYFFLDIIAQ
jgi:hypothetical protein